MKYTLLLLLLTPFLLSLDTEEAKQTFTYTLTGETAPIYNGKKVYLHNTSINNLIDSTTVSDSTFTFVGKLDSIVENMVIAKISIGKEDITVVLEEGDITISIKSEIAEVNGTPHNEILNAFNIAELKLYSDLQYDMNKAQLEFEDDETLLQQRDIELVDRYNIDSKHLYDSIFNANRLNIIGAYLYPRTLSNKPSSIEISEFMSENAYAKKDSLIIELLLTSKENEVEDMDAEVCEEGCEEVE